MSTQLALWSPPNIERPTMSQTLRRNHVMSHARAVAKEGAWLSCCPKHRNWDRECAIGNLVRAYALAIECGWDSEYLDGLVLAEVNEGSA